MTYAEKLKDPRWQKKRLEILQRDKFTCRNCFSTENTLHVHHFCYERGKEPWEADDISLITYCEDCHKIKHAYPKMSALEVELIEYIGMINYMDGQFHRMQNVNKLILEHI